LVKDAIRAVIPAPVWRGTSHPAPGLLQTTKLRENTEKKKKPTQKEARKSKIGLNT